MNNMARKINSKEILQIALLLVIFAFSLKFFQSTPYERLFFQLQALFLGFVVFFLLFYTMDALMVKRRINKIVFYFILLIIIVPPYSAFRACIEFGQPFIYGFLSERAWLLMGVGVWFYYMIANQKAPFEALEKAFIFMAWTSLIVFSFFIITYDPTKYQAVEGIDKLIKTTALRGVRFKFNTYFITFGVIYYFVKYDTSRNVKPLILLLVFLSYVVFIVQGRTYMLALSATFLLYYWFNYSLGEFVFKVAKLLVLFFIVLLLIGIFWPAFLQHMEVLFKQMFIVLTGKEGVDPSANSRIFQTEIVLQYWRTHPLCFWLGAGRLSWHWNGGFNGLLGYFYPSDLGVLGGLFLYGVVGIVPIFIAPLMICVITLKKISGHKRLSVTALKYFLIFFMLNPIVGGSFYFGYVSYSIPLFILLAYNKLQERQHAN